MLVHIPLNIRAHISTGSIADICLRSHVTVTSVNHTGPFSESAHLITIMLITNRGYTYGYLPSSLASTVVFHYEFNSVRR